MIFSYLLNMQSHPSWVCGLKPVIAANKLATASSHPSWVCGLKPIEIFGYLWLFSSHPSWVCGLKLPRHNVVVGLFCHTLRGCVD